MTLAVLLLSSLSQKVDEIRALTDTCRYLAAKIAYEQLISEINVDTVSGDVREGILTQLNNDSGLQTMLSRAEQVQHSLDFVDSSNDWILGADMFGIHTHYKKCEDDENQIVVKIEGTMDDLPLFEQMAVIHEIDLYHEWAPFCTDSVLIDKIGKAELYGYGYSNFLWHVLPACNA